MPPTLILVEVNRDFGLFKDIPFARITHELPYLLGEIFGITTDRKKKVVVKTFDFDVRFDNSFPLLIIIRVFHSQTSGELKEIKKQIKKLVPARMRNSIRIELSAG